MIRILGISLCIFESFLTPSPPVPGRTQRRASRHRVGRAAAALTAALYHMRFSADAFGCRSDADCNYPGCVSFK